MQKEKGFKFGETGESELKSPHLHPIKGEDKLGPISRIGTPNSAEWEVTFNLKDLSAVWLGHNLPGEEI